MSSWLLHSVLSSLQVVIICLVFAAIMVETMFTVAVKPSDERASGGLGRLLVAFIYGRSWRGAVCISSIGNKYPALVRCWQKSLTQ